MQDVGHILKCIMLSVNLVAEGEVVSAGMAIIQLKGDVMRVAEEVSGKGRSVSEGDCACTKVAAVGLDGEVLGVTTACSFDRDRAIGVQGILWV
jgi:hypothetical protein